MSYIEILSPFFSFLSLIPIFAKEIGELSIYFVPIGSALFGVFFSVITENYMEKTDTRPIEIRENPAFPAARVGPKYDRLGIPVYLRWLYGVSTLIIIFAIGLHDFYTNKVREIKNQR